MRIQNLKGGIEEGRIVLSWELTEPPKAVCVELGGDPEFVRTPRRFLVPVTTGIALDMGAGAWWYRVGAVLGTDNAGSVDWSGIYGPLRVEGAKAVVPLPPARLKIRRSENLVDGVFVETGVREEYIAFLDLSTDREFRAGAVATYYLRDHGRGGFDFEGKMKEGELYHLRVSTVFGDWRSWPSATVETFCEGRTLLNLRLVKPATKIVAQTMRGTVDAVTRQPTGSDRVQSEMHRVLLREAQEKPVQRFATQADYLRFVQMKTMNRVGR